MGSLLRLALAVMLCLGSVPSVRALQSSGSAVKVLESGDLGDDLSGLGKTSTHKAGKLTPVGPTGAGVMAFWARARDLDAEGDQRVGVYVGGPGAVSRIAVTKDSLNQNMLIDGRPRSGRIFPSFGGQVDVGDGTPPAGAIAISADGQKVVFEAIFTSPPEEVQSDFPDEYHGIFSFDGANFSFIVPKFTVVHTPENPGGEVTVGPLFPHRFCHVFHLQLSGAGMAFTIVDELSPLPKDKVIVNETPVEYPEGSTQSLKLAGSRHAVVRRDYATRVGTVYVDGSARFSEGGKFDNDKMQIEQIRDEITINSGGSFTVRADVTDLTTGRREPVILAGDGTQFFALRFPVELAVSVAGPSALNDADDMLLIAGTQGSTGDLRPSLQIHRIDYASRTSRLVARSFISDLHGETVQARPAYASLTGQNAVGYTILHPKSGVTAGTYVATLGAAEDCDRFNVLEFTVLTKHELFKPDGVTFKLRNVREVLVRAEFPSENKYPLFLRPQTWYTLNRMFVRFYQMEDTRAAGENFMTFDAKLQTTYCGSLMAVTACPDQALHPNYMKCERVAYIQFIRESHGRSPRGVPIWDPWKLDVSSDGKSPEYVPTKKGNHEFVMFDGPGNFYKRDKERVGDRRTLEFRTWVICKEPSLSIEGYFSWGLEAEVRGTLGRQPRDVRCHVTHNYPQSFINHDPKDPDFQGIYVASIGKQFEKEYVPGP